MGTNEKGASSVAGALFVLFFALCISGVAAYYSIVGLMAIFAGAALSIAIMGGALEVGKLIAASWLYNNWGTAPFFMKSYLTVAIIVLMFITSMGIFGFLSKAHLEQVGPAGNHQAKIVKIDHDILQQEKRIARSEAVLAQLETGLKTYFDMGYVTRGLKERAKQKEERQALDAEILAANKRIDKLSDTRFEEQKEILGIEAEVGPIKYIAALVYGEEEADKHQGEAVRWMIILLIFVFDPLAVLLVIAGNMSLFAARNSSRGSSNDGDRSRSLKKVTGNTEEDPTPNQTSNIDNSNPSKKHDPSPLEVSEGGEVMSSALDANEVLKESAEANSAEVADSSKKQHDPTEERTNGARRKDLDNFKDRNDLDLSATDSNGDPLPIEIEAKSPIFTCDIEGVIEETLKNTSMGFNFEGPVLRQLTQQLAKALRKNKL